jgi:2-polyprenyl-3-methyl-5-hydroxy-6-metoxy-1,4-benzoquinol methylase
LSTILESNSPPSPNAFEAQPPQSAFDPGKLEAFMRRIIGDMSGAVVSTMCTIGDRLGLFKLLAASGPTTSTELAERAGISERYAREWLNAVACGGYLEYDPSSRRFTLPPEYMPILAQEGGPMFMGGVYQHMPGLFGQLDLLMEAFRHDGGVSQQAFGEEFRQGMERISAGWFDNMLTQQWIPLVPDTQSLLERGARVADVGCGSGRALIKLAQAFPNSSFVGYDMFQPAIDRANVNARVFGVADRVSFEQRDAAEGLSGQFDLITTFDVMHDINNPLAVLQGFRRALVPGGTYLLLEINCSEKLEENVGPVGAILYGTSVLYCTPTSLANGGDGLGTMGLPETKIRELCTAAGFGTVRRYPLGNPFNVLYEVRP